MSKVLLSVEKLSYSYPDGKTALDDVSFSIHESETAVLLGPNGSGKTTLLLHLNGTFEGTGSVLYRGEALSKSNVARIRRQVGVLFQDPDGQLFMPNVLEDVMFGLLSSGWAWSSAEQRALEALAEVGLSREFAARPPFHLSSGEKRRVALAGILVMEPELLVLDEPTSWLDPPGQKDLTKILAELPQAKLIATHDIPFASKLAERAIFLQAGRILADGPLPNIVAEYNWR